MSLRDRCVGKGIEVFLGPGTALTSAAHRAWRIVARKPRTVVLFYQVDDPYSHLLVQAMRSLVTRHDVKVDVHVIRGPLAEGGTPPEALAAYAQRDATQLASHLGLELPASRPTAPLERVRRARGWALRAAQSAQPLTELCALGQRFWSGHELQDTDLSNGALLGAERRLRRMGHYQAAMLFYQGQWFWGVDRIDYLEDILASEDGASPSHLWHRESIAEPPALDLAAPTESKGSEASRAGGIRLYSSFRSPYSYLVLPRLFALAEKYSTPIDIRPVLPMVMRGLAVPRAKRLYIVRDAMREARRHDVQFGQICDPLGDGVRRALAAFAVAKAAKRQREFVLSFGQGVFGEARNATIDTDLAFITERAGLNWSDVKAGLDDRGWEETARQHRTELLNLGLWGVPCMQVGAEATWGQDRLWLVEQWLRQA